MNRYRVITTWGEVPEQIRDIVGKDGAYLLYPEYRGVYDVQHFHENSRGIIGGWSMQFAGTKRD